MTRPNSPHCQKTLSVIIYLMRAGERGPTELAAGKLKPGDKVAVFDSRRARVTSSPKLIRIDTISKITATQIVTDHSRFRKDTGTEMGFGHLFIVPVKPEHEAELRVHQDEDKNEGLTKS